MPHRQRQVARQPTEVRRIFDFAWYLNVLLGGFAIKVLENHANGPVQPAHLVSCHKILSKYRGDAAQE